MQTSGSQGKQQAGEKDAFQTEEQGQGAPDTSCQKQSKPKMWSKISGYSKGKKKKKPNCQSINLYQVKMYFKNEGKVKTF